MGSDAVSTVEAPIRRRRRVDLLLAVLIAAGACRFSTDAHLGSDDDGDDDGTTPTPAYGDGSDGALTVTGELVLDSCHTLQSASGTTLVVGTSAAGFLPTGPLLLHQVRDDVPAVSGDLADYDEGASGRWEIAWSVSFTAGPPLSATLASSLLSSYATDSRRSAQVCKLPQFRSVHVTSTGRLRPTPWDGVEGGVLAFLVSDDLSVDVGGHVSADGRGFRGGQLATNNGCSGTMTALDFALTNGNGGGKGEGLDAASYGIGGKGNRANAGGGGNACNWGGAGGANGGDGGSGGGDANGAGIPGQRVDSSQTLLLLGGGGGAGQRGENGAGPGGAGGGIFFGFVRLLAGAGTISASGNNGEDGTLDGGGGGGAGGTIALYAADANGFTGSIAAVGGDGGSVDDGASRGPGGGGGGGRVHAPASPSASRTTEGGTPGTHNGSSDGALGGVSGVVTTTDAL